MPTKKSPEAAPYPMAPIMDKPSAPTSSRPAMNDAGMLQSYRALPHAEDAGVMTTLDLSTRTNVVALQNALAGDSVSLWDVQPDRVIRVTDLIAHYSHYVSEETGEEVSGPMLTLIGPDGVFHTGSEYAFRGLQMIAFASGRPPWRPPVAIRAIRCRSRKQREYQSIILVE